MCSSRTSLINFRFDRVCLLCAGCHLALSHQAVCRACSHFVHPDLSFAGPQVGWRAFVASSSFSLTNVSLTILLQPYQSLSYQRVSCVSSHLVHPELASAGPQVGWRVLVGIISMSFFSESLTILLSTCLLKLSWTRAQMLNQLAGECLWAVSWRVIVSTAEGFFLRCVCQLPFQRRQSICHLCSCMSRHGSLPCRLEVHPRPAGWSNNSGCALFGP